MEVNKTEVLRSFNKALIDTINNPRNKETANKVIKEHIKTRTEESYRKDTILTPFQVNIVI